MVVVWLKQHPIITGSLVFAFFTAPSLIDTYWDLFQKYQAANMQVTWYNWLLPIFPIIGLILFVMIIREFRKPNQPENPAMLLNPSVTSDKPSIKAGKSIKAGGNVEAEGDIRAGADVKGGHETPVLSLEEVAKRTFPNPH